MQCQRAIRRVCSAHNAYNPAFALRATFGTTARLQQDDEPVQYQPPELVTPPPPRTSRPNPKHEGIRPLGPREPSGKKSKRTPKPTTPSPARTSRPKPEHGGTSPFEAAEPKSMNFITSVRDRIMRCVETETAFANGSVQRRQWERTAFYDQWQMHMLQLRQRLDDLATPEGQQVLARLNEEERSMIPQTFDYHPTIIIPKLPRGTRTPPILPWAISLDEGKGKEITGSHQLLSVQMERFAQLMEPTPVEKLAREGVIDHVLDTIKKLNSGSETSRTGIEVFGSEKTGLADPLSDIDFRVYDLLDDVPGSLLNKRMGALFSTLNDDDRFIATTMRLGKHPIINCQHRESGIDVQLVAGPPTTRQQEVTAHYLSTIPNLREFFTVVRTTLAIRGFTDVFNGAIGSYALLIMIVASLSRPLQQNEPTTLSNYLGHFLVFYSDLDTTKYGIAVSPTKPRFKKHPTSTSLQPHREAALRRGDPVRAGQWHICQTKLYTPYNLCVQDPADPTNDLTRRAYATKHIMVTLKGIRGELAKRLRKMQGMLNKRAAGGDFDLQKVPSFMLPLVGRSCEVYQPGRQRLHEFGVKVKEAREKEVEGLQESVQELEAPKDEEMETQLPKRTDEGEREDLFEKMAAESAS